MMKEEQSGSIVGVGWYSPQEWALLKACAVDGDKLDRTYEDWRANAERTLSHLRSQGFRAVRVHVRVGELFAWCEQRKKALNGEARSQFVLEKVQAGNSDADA